MFGGFLFVEPMVAILLGKGLSTAELKDLALIAKVGVMQIPVAVVVVLCNKLSVAVGRSSPVMYSSLLAFAVNFALNLLLVPQVGVLGVAVGSLLGGVVSLIVVLAGVYEQIALSLRDVVVALAAWLAWVAVCVSLSSGSVAASTAGIILLLFMARLQWRVFVSGNQNDQR
jgi:hypothetical protein